MAAGVLQVLKYIRDNRALVRNTYHSVSRELLEGYLYRVTYQLMRDVVEERAAGTQVPEEDRPSWPTSTSTPLWG